jgi:FkbM family methyltransferase
MSTKLKIFNFLRNLLRLTGVDRLLPFFTSGKGYDSFFVKCIPQNYQYPGGVFRKATRNGIHYALDLSEYMEWVIYFDLNVEHRDELYPLVKQGMVILDVGGNIGETALNFAKLTGVNGRVISFEPVPETYRKFLVNLKLNDFSWLKAEQIALSDTTEKLYFDPASYNNSGGIYMRKNTDGLNFSVNALRLDEYVISENLARVDLVKIDVEGFELNVLKGAVHTLKLMRPVLFVEINGYNLSRQQASTAQIFNLLSDAGYSIFCEGIRVTVPPDKLHYDIIAMPDPLKVV